MNHRLLGRTAMIALWLVAPACGGGAEQVDRSAETEISADAGHAADNGNSGERNDDLQLDQEISEFVGAQCREDRATALAGCAAGETRMMPCVQGLLSANLYCQPAGPDAECAEDAEFEAEEGECEEDREVIVVPCVDGVLVQAEATCSDGEGDEGEECVEGEAVEGDCPNGGDRITPCVNGYWGETHCEGGLSANACESDRVLAGGCAAGALVTECVDGAWGESKCVAEGDPAVECEDDRVIADGCENGDLVTECMEGVWGQSQCVTTGEETSPAQCTEDLIEIGGCPAGDLVTVCMSNHWDETYCEASETLNPVCSEDLVESGMCPNGDLITACVGGQWGPTQCVVKPGGQECDADKVVQGGCPNGDLVTPCESGEWGASECVSWPAECQEDLVVQGGCTGGDEITPCVDSFYGLPYCRPLPPGEVPAVWEGCKALTSQVLKDCLFDGINGHKSVGYSQAKEEMFGNVSNDNGEVECVYTGRRITTPGIPGNGDMNTEHSWPQSKGADVEPAKSDLNHLFPTDSSTNSRRSNLPFCEVVSSSWDEGGSFLGTSSKGTKCFEPRDKHKGDVARAMMYFAVRYNYNIDAEQEGFFRKWNWLDPPDEWERQRLERIASIQGKRNPFVDFPAFADVISDL